MLCQGTLKNPQTKWFNILTKQKSCATHAASSIDIDMCGKDLKIIGKIVLEFTISVPIYLGSRTSAG